MQAPYRVRLLRAFEASLILVVLAGQGTFLLSVLSAAGVDVTPGISIATAGWLSVMPSASSGGYAARSLAA
ncbi:MAG: hypothetical protein ACXWUM_05645 [Burkholderiaceae bacterium]